MNPMSIQGFLVRQSGEQTPVFPRTSSRVPGFFPVSSALFCNSPFAYLLLTNSLQAFKLHQTGSYCSCLSMAPNPSQCQLAGARSLPWHELVHFQCPDATCVLWLMQAWGHLCTALPVLCISAFVLPRRSTDV